MEEGSTSSCVEDVFFVIRKCCMRAVAIGEEECAIKVLSRSKGLLVSSFIPHLSKRARQLFPDAKSGDSVMVKALMCVNWDSPGARLSQMMRQPLVCVWKGSLTSSGSC